MRKPLPTTLAAALALALAAPLAFSQSTAPRATVTSVTPTNGSTASTSSTSPTATGTNGSTGTTSSGATATTGAGVTPNASPSLRPPPVTDPVNAGTTSNSRAVNTTNTATTGTTGTTGSTGTGTTTTADGSTGTGATGTTTGTTAGQTSGTGTGSTSPGATGTSSTTANVNRAIVGPAAVTNADGSTTLTRADGSTQVLTRDQTVGAAGGRGISVPIPQDAGPGRALTHEEEQALRDRLRAEQSLARTPGNGNGMIVMSPGTPQARVMAVNSPEQERAAKRAQKSKARPMNNMIVPRTDNDRTNQMPDDPIVRY